MVYTYINVIEMMNKSCIVLILVVMDGVHIPYLPSDTEGRIQS